MNKAKTVKIYIYIYILKKHRENIESRRIQNHVSLETILLQEIC